MERRSFIKSSSAGIASILASKTAPVFAMSRGVKGEVTLEEAQSLHNKCLIIDGHQDSSVRRFSRNEDPHGWIKRQDDYHSDIPRMLQDGQQYVGLFLIEDATATDLWTITEFMLTEIDTHPDKFKLVLTSDDAIRAGKEGKVGVILEIEGPARWLQGNLNVVSLLYRLGLRSQHITHGEGGSEPHYLQGTRSKGGLCTLKDREDQRRSFVGLTPFGKDVVKLQNELGIVVDTAHSNDKAYYDVMEHSTTPPIMSHTAVYALCNQYRCLTDDQIKVMAERGGVMGVVILPGYINPEKEKATLDNVVDHILYVRDLVGIETIGFGSDYDGFSDVPLVESHELVLLTKRMMERGMTADEIEKFWGGNFLRVLKEVVG